MSCLLSILLAAFVTASAAPNSTADVQASAGRQAALQSVFAERLPLLSAQVSSPLEAGLQRWLDRSSAAEITFDEVFFGHGVSAIECQFEPVPRIGGLKSHVDTAASFLCCRRLPLRC